MFSTTDYDKLRLIMEESPEKKELLTRLLESHRMEVSTISHEIRNPLTLVYSTLQLIEAQHPEVRSIRHWDSMRQDIEYMNQLLEELSSYNNGEKLTLTSSDTTVFLRTLVLSFASSLMDTEIEFTSRIAPNLPALLIDSVKIRQTLLNLLRNAQDAVSSRTDSQNAVSSPRDSYHPSIRLDAEYMNHAVTISITDNGVGIDAGELTSIFDPFVTHKKGGTGLGLAIAKRIVSAHGGSIYAESTPGEGSSFMIILPVQQDA